MPKNRQQLRYEDQLAEAVHKYTANAAVHDVARKKQELQTEGGRRRLTAAEAALAYSPAEDARHQPRR